MTPLRLLALLGLTLLGLTLLGTGRLLNRLLELRYTHNSASLIVVFDRSGPFLIVRISFRKSSGALTAQEPLVALSGGFLAS
jgi:hypothetical protein